MKRVWMAALASAASGCLLLDPAESTRVWVGRTGDDVIRQWGAPTETAMLADSSRVMTWRERGGSCARSFTVDKGGVVQHWRITGCGGAGQSGL